MHYEDYKKDVIEILLDYSLIYINSCLRRRKTCLFNIAKSIYNYIEENPKRNIIYIGYDKYEININDILEILYLPFLELIEQYDFLKIIPQSDIQFLIVRVE